MLRAPEPSLSGVASLNGRAVWGPVVGDECYRAALNRLSRADREIYESATPISWIPIRIVDAVIETAARFAGLDPIETMVRTSRITMEQSVRTLWRPLLRLTSDHALLTRAPALFRRAYSHGALVVTFPEPCAAVVELREWPSVSEMQVAGLGAGIAAVLRIAGRKNPQVRTSRTPAGASFAARWR